MKSTSKKPSPPSLSPKALHHRLREHLSKHGAAMSAAFKKGRHEFREALGDIGVWVRGQCVRCGRGLFAFWKKIEHVVFAALILLVTIATVLGGLFAFYSMSFNERVLVKVRAPGIDLSGRTYHDALEELRTSYAAFSARGIPVEVAGTRYTIPIESLGIEYDIEATAQKAFAIGHSGDFWQDQRDRLKAIFVTQQAIDPEEIIHEEHIEQGLRAAIPELNEPARNATVSVVDNRFVVVPAATGTTTDFGAVTDQIRTALTHFEPPLMHIEVRPDEPEITDEEAERVRAIAATRGDANMQLTYNDHGAERAWAIEIVRDRTWIAFRADGPVLVPTLHDAKLRAFIGSEIEPTVNQTRIDARITMPTDGGHYATIEGRAEDGYSVLVEDTVRQTQRDFENGLLVSALHVAYEPGRILTASGEDVGLHDLLGVGWSNFSNSEAGRRFNVGFGLEKFNGLLIAPGEEFSFKDWLGGPIELSTGWKPALAIFDGGATTEKVPGGGLCQVSTTMYRAALRAGLPITEVKHHSFYVNHYTEGGDGLDATVYPPRPDLKFVNDTGNLILVQTYTEGDDAYVKFYGTSDKRTVVLDGPHKSGWISPGGPNVIETTALPVGTELQKSPARLGRQITWYQTVTYPDGREEKNTITSKYAAIPAQIQRGVSVVTQPPAEPVSSEVIL